VEVADQNAHCKNILKSLKGNPKKFYVSDRFETTLEMQCTNANLKNPFGV